MYALDFASNGTFPLFDRHIRSKLWQKDRSGMSESTKHSPISKLHIPLDRRKLGSTDFEGRKYSNYWSGSLHGSSFFVHLVRTNTQPFFQYFHTCLSSVNKSALSPIEFRTQLSLPPYIHFSTWIIHPMAYCIFTFDTNRFYFVAVVP